MKKLLHCIVFLFALSLGLGAAEIQPVKYVFLFIGDGMSIPQRMSADEYLARTENRTLQMNKMPCQAITTTRSATEFITDSAAAGTAIACGEKTKNGRIGMDTDGKRKLESIADAAKRSGRKVGIVTSVTLNHATPAAFYGKRQSRGMSYELGLDLVSAGFDYYGGGEISRHNDTKNKAYIGDIYDLAAKAGYTVTHDRAGFEKLNASSGKVLAIGAKGALPYAIDRKEGDLTLAEFTAKGIELLDNPKGFFLMVEGGKIDWMCHANDAATVMQEMIDFDQAISVALAFAEKYPEDTLVVVTGDHETGGLTLGFAGTGYKTHIELLARQTCSSDVFHDKVKALFKQNEKVTFDMVKPVITESFGLQFTDDQKNPMRVKPAEEKELQDAFESMAQDQKKNGKKLVLAALKIFNGKASVGWTTGAHTALPVNTSAIGKNARTFSGMIDNTDIAKKLKEAVR